MEKKKLILAGMVLKSGLDEPLRNQIISIRGNKIENISTIDKSFRRKNLANDTEVIDARRKIVIPGFINAHCHHTEVMQRSLRDRLPFELWRVERRGIEDCLKPGYDELLTANLLALLESLKHGTTSVLHHFSRRNSIDLDEIRACVDAASMVGIRTTIAPSLSDTGWRNIVTISEKPPTAQREIEALKDSLKLISSAPETIRGIVGPSSIHTCSDWLLGQCLSISDEMGTGIHTHFLETRLEASQRSDNGETPMQRAFRLGLLNPKVSFAHAVHLLDSELDMLARGKATVVHNPCSNMKLGSGFARVREMLDRGINVALGSDGGDTSDGYSIFDQMKMAAFMKRCLDHDFNNWISAKEVFIMATTGGAKCLNINAGKIGPGYLADICILKPGIRMWAGLNPVQTLVFAENGASVDTVLVNGEIILEKGKSALISESELKGKVKQLAEKVRIAEKEWIIQKSSKGVIEKYQSIEKEYRNSHKKI